MKNIFVGNLSFQTTEQDVRTLFEAHGSVDRETSSPTVNRVNREDLASSK